MKTPNPRYFVPDLSPMDRQALAGLKPKYVFVAESPHTSEVEPTGREERRPLCGAAGRAWWKMLGELFEGKTDADVSLERMLRLCKTHQFAVINAIQYPIDPKIERLYPDADPVPHLGFCKAAGENGYKKLREDASVQAVIERLRQRLMDPAFSGAQIWSLGNDAEWFVTRALSPTEQQKKLKGRIPHPSAWWRRGGAFERIAREKLSAIFISNATLT